MFQNPFQPDCYYYRENGYRIVACNVYRYNEEIGLCWIEGFYITIGWCEENSPTIYDLTIRWMKIISGLSIRAAMLVYAMSWPDHLEGNVFSMIMVQQLDLYGDMDIRNCIANPEAADRND